MNELRKHQLTQLRKMICLVSILIMLAGLLFSRFLLSAGLIIFAASCLLGKSVKAKITSFFYSPLLWSMSLLFLLPLISGLWSQDTLKWSQILRIKLPLFLLPLCVAGLDDFKKEDWQKIGFTFLSLVLLGAGWSLWQYLQNVQLVQEAYLRAQTIQTPMGNDHVRFSLMVSIAILTAVFLAVQNQVKKAKGVLIGLWLAVLLLVIYLHVLAARTGLICFYVSAFITVSWLVAKAKNSWRYAWVFVLIIAIPFVSWFAFPTFRNRISYIRYDLSSVKDGAYRIGSNDGNRLMSMKAGWELQKEHPIAGVGFGDIEAEARKWYLASYPQMSDADRILPSSEWTIYGAGGGWPGFLLFSMIMAVPFFCRAREANICWVLLNISITLSYLFDIGLEVQYGVFIHAFILLWWYKWLNVAPKIENVGKV
jgi:O-antigen ligase